MKKSIIALCCLILVIIYFAFFQIRRVDKVSLDGYVSSISIEDIASNLKSSKNVTINLETVNDGDYLYKNNSNYYIGEENKTKVYLDVPIYNKDNSRVLNYLENSYINARYYDTGSLTNVTLADKNIYNTNVNERIDDDTYLFTKLKQNLYLNNVDLTLKLVNNDLTIPAYSIIYFNQDYLNYYYRVNSSLVLKTIDYLSLETKLNILDNTISYEALLTNLGLYSKTTKKDDYVPEPDKPNYDNKDNDNDNKKNDTSSDFDLIIKDTDIIINEDPDYDNNGTVENYVRPEVTFDGFTGNVYSAAGNLTINDPASRIITNPTFVFKFDDKTYLRKSFFSNGQIKVTGLTPKTTFEIEGYFIFKNKNNETVKRTFYTGSVTTKDIEGLNAINFRYQINKIFPSKVVLDEFAFTNDADDEVIGGIKSINIKLNKQEFSVSSTLLNKLKNSNAVTYQTPEVLESNTDYEGIIEVIDVSGNKLKVTNNTFNTKTSKKAPTVTINQVKTDLTFFEATINLSNKDKVALKDYHYEIYNTNNELVKEENLDSTKEANNILVDNLDSNELYKIYVIGSYDLEDGSGTLENQVLVSAQITTKPISALGYVKFIVQEQEITKDSGTYTLKINKESTDEKLIALLDRVIINVKHNDNIITTITISGEKVEDLKNLGTYEFQINGLNSNTEYTLEYQTIEKQINKEYLLAATANITNIKTLRTPAYAVITNQFTNESIIDFDVRIVDNDNAIQTNRALIQVKDELGNYVLLSELSINGNEQRITLNKLTKDTKYNIDIIAEGYNEGYTNITYKTNYVLEGSRILTTKLGVTGSIRLENLLSVVTSQNIFNLRYTDNFRFDGNSGINKIDTDIDNKVIKFSAMNGYANYSYYLPEYKDIPVIVTFKAKYAEGSNHEAAYLTVGAGSNATYPLNLTDEDQEYKIELIPDNGYLGFRVNETGGNNNTTTIEVTNFQIVPYLNYNAARTMEMAIYDRDYIFKDTTILSGNDLITEPDGTEATGHIGDGYARITNLATNATYNYDYTGTVSNFTVPETGNYKIEVWGASGGDNYSNKYLTANSHGGRGGYSSGTITLQKDDTLYVVVGGRGKYGYGHVAGGFNGGGTGGASSSGSGGGATDVRLKFGVTDTESLKSRIIVAGGGGGSDDAGTCYENCSLSNDGSGGAGGGLTTEGAYIDGILHTGYAAGQLPFTTKNFTGTLVDSSSLGIGENGSNTDTGGGGGGYYGGVATKHYNGGGSGGSSFISGHIGCISVNYKDNLQKDDTYQDYEEKYQYQGTFYINVTDNNFELTGTPEIPNDDFYIEILKSDGSNFGNYHYYLDDNETIDHKVTDMIVAYNFEKGTTYTLNLNIFMNNRYYTISTLNFTTDNQIRTIRTKEEFYNMSSTGNFLIDNDIDLRYSNRTIYGEFNGNIDFQGHKLLLNVKNSASRVFEKLGKGAIFKNMDMHIWYDEARSRYDTLTDWSSATFSNIMITIEEAVTTPAEQISFLVRVNRGTVDHFVVHNKAEIQVTRYFGFISNYIYGTVKNGYLYGEKINGNHDSSLDEIKYIGAIGAYMSENGYIENVYSLIDVAGYVDSEKPNQIQVGNLVGSVSRGTINNVYSYNEGTIRNTSNDASAGYYDQLNASKLYYVSPLKFSNAKSLKISKVALTSSEFQENTLNGEKAFDIENFVSYGYFPQLIMNEVMPKQEYIKLPSISDADILNILTTNVVSQSGNEAYVDILLRNPSEEKINDIKIQYLTTNIIKQVHNEDGTTTLSIKISNPSKYISVYGINSITATSKTGITYTTDFPSGTVVLNVDMYREINSEKDWLNMAKNSSENFSLQKDLDFKDYNNPIINTTITGKIEGNNHTISNMKVTTNEGIAFRAFQGRLSNLYFENLTKTNYATTSGLIGYLQSSATMDNVHVKNITLKLGFYTGGLTGLSRYSSNIKNSSVTNLNIIDTTDIDGMRVGGLVGQTESSNILNSYAQDLNLDLTNSSQLYAVGGIVGYNSYGIIENAYSTGNINISYPNVGGIAGVNYGRVQYVISNVKIISNQVYAGGIVGNDYNSNVSNTLFTGELYSSLKDEIHRTIGNENLSNHNLYAWASQRINGMISNNSQGEDLLTTEELNNPESYVTKIDIGTSFATQDVAGNKIPKLYYANTNELLPNQKDNYLNIIADDVLKVKSINAVKDLTSADITLEIANADTENIKVTGIKIEDIEEISEDDIKIYNENSGVPDTSIIRVTIRPKYYLDSYRVSKLYYTDNGVKKEITVDSKIDVTFFRNINSVDDFQKINTNYSENYSLNANLDFSNISSSIIRNGIMVNRLEGNNYTISNYNLDTNKGGIYIFKEVKSYIKNITFENINLTYTGTAYTTGLGIIGSAYGKVSNVTLKNMTLDGKKLVNHVGFIANSYVTDYRNITIDGANLSGTHRLGSLYAEGDTYYLTTVSLNNVHVDGTSDFVGGLIGYKHYVDAQRHYNVTASLVHVTTDGGTYSGIVYGYGAATNVEVTNSSVSGNDQVGGIGGQQDTGGTYNLHLDNVEVTAKGSQIGGLYGYHRTIGDSYIKNSLITGGTSQVGGIGGYGGYTLYNCSVINTTISSPNANSVGGLEGLNWDSNRYNNYIYKVKVEGKNYVGGLIGNKNGTPNNSYYNNFVNATVTSSGVGAGGLLGYYQNDLEGENIRRINIYNNLIASSTITANDAAGGLIGSMYKATDPLYNLFYYNVIAANINTTGSNTNSGIIVGTNDLYIKGLKNLFVYNNSKINGLPASTTVTGLSDTITYISLNNLKNNSLIKSYLGNSTAFNYSEVDKGYYPYNGGADAKLYQVLLPSGPITTFRSRMLINNFRPLSNVTIYPSSIDTLNFDFDTIGDTITINGHSYEITNNTLSVYYNYNEDITYTLSNGRYTKEYKISKEDLRNTINTLNDYYYYLDNGNIISNNGNLLGNYIHLYKNEALDSEGNILNINTGDIKKISVKNFEKLSNPLEIVSYEYRSSKINTYGTYSTIDNKKMTNQIFIKGINMGMISSNLNNLKNKVIIDNYNNKKVLVTLVNGKLTSLMNDIKLPSDFINQNIIDMTSNINDNSSIILVKYDDNTYYAFDYKTGKKLEIVSLNQDENKNKTNISITDFMKNYLSNTSKNKNIVSLEKNYETTNNFITNLDMDEIINYTGYDISDNNTVNSSNSNNILDNYTVSYNPLKKEYEIYNISYITNNSVSEENASTSINDVINKTSTLQNSFIKKYKGKDTDSISGKYIFIIIIIIISIALSLLGITLKSIYYKKKNFS